MELRITHLPYCIQRLDDGRYIILNRHYKPLGVLTNDWITYQTDPSAVVLNITPSQARKLSWESSDNLERIYLYNDASIPTRSDTDMRDYLDRLAVLMRLTHKDTR